MKENNNKIMIVVISLIIVLCGIIGFIIFENKTKNYINKSNNKNIKALLPIYQCDSDSEANGINVIIGDKWLDEYVNSNYTDYDCNIKYLYECEYSLCYSKDDYGLGKYKIIYDNNKNGDGGYYLIDVNYNKKLIGPYKSIDYLGNKYDRKLLIQDKKTEKYGIYSTMYPRETLSIEPTYDYIGSDYIATIGDKYYLLNELDENPSKFDLIISDKRESYSSSSLLYTFVKDKKMNLGIHDDDFMFSKWYDVIMNKGSFESSKNISDLYIVYIDNNKLHFAYTYYNAKDMYYDLPNGVIDLDFDKEEFYLNWLTHNTYSYVDYKEDKEIETFKLYFIYNYKTYTYTYDFNTKTGNISVIDIKYDH